MTIHHLRPGILPLHLAGVQPCGSQRCSTRVDEYFSRSLICLSPEEFREVFIFFRVSDTVKDFPPHPTEALCKFTELTQQDFYYRRLKLDPLFRLLETM